MRATLATDLKSRDGDTGQDARLVNAYVDVKRGIPFVSKRPALEAALELPVGTGSFSTLGQALYVWQEVDVDSTTLTTSVVGIRGDAGKKTPDTKALLYFTTQPSTASLNTAISPAVVVTARDKFGNTKTDFTGNVTLVFATNRYGATLGGTLTVAAVAGVATFSNVTLNRSGSGFALGAISTGSKKAAPSSTFDVPTTLTFTTPPSTVQADQTFSVVVAAKDNSGNTDTNYTGNITISLNGTPGVLSGTLTQTASAGSATFSGLSINANGTYTIDATGTDVAGVYSPFPVQSDSFNVTDAYILTSVQTGDTIGLFGVSFGSISPTTYGGFTIEYLYSFYPGASGTGSLVLTGDSSPPTQDLFTSITVGGETRLSASATFFGSGNSRTWYWPGATLVTAAGELEVTFT